METKIFKGKEIKIRKLSTRDLKHVKKFQDFINSLVEEGAKILWNKKISLGQEKKWLEAHLKNIKNHNRIFLVAECDDIIVGTTSIGLERGRKSHIGHFGITIKKDYRGIGLGNYLTKEILRLAKKELKNKPKIISLEVYPINKPAIALYKKHGFKKVATIPDQIEYKGKLISTIIMLLYL